MLSVPLTPTVDWVIDTGDTARGAGGYGFSVVAANVVLFGVGP